VLGVSRNTVVLAYQGLLDDGYLMARERSGYFVSDKAMAAALPGARPAGDAAAAQRGPDWKNRFALLPSRQENIVKPLDWQRFEYPFIYGQLDHGLFPIAEWRDCARQALGRRFLGVWTNDAGGHDDPLLVEQIRRRILPRRGILAADEEILVTLGAQNALYLLSSLLVRKGTRVAMEEPGYRDARNIFALHQAQIDYVAVDAEGLPPNDLVARADIVFVTPSHQSPTTVTLPVERRRALLELASKRDAIVIEDDYEFETNYLNEPAPALKSLDAEGRVVYVGSLSKTVFPGLRLGFMVGPRPLIAEARALRRLMMRHPPNNNQRTAALFLSLGHYDSLIRRLHRVYRERWQVMGESLRRYMPGMARAPGFGGTSYWVRGPASLDADLLAQRLVARSVFIEPGRVQFGGPNPPSNFFRLGFSSIATAKIEPGIRIVAEELPAAFQPEAAE
jgi:GntR family transcriptional regulator/MocR family aminotransferase